MKLNAFEIHPVLIDDATANLKLKSQTKLTFQKAKVS